MKVKIPRKTALEGENIFMSLIVEGFGTALAIGSFSWEDVDKTLSVIFQYFGEVPLWPQLPNLNIKEQMYTQFYDGIGGIRLDELRGKLYALPQGDEMFEEMSKTLEHAALEDVDFFAIPENKAKGFYKFLEKKEEIQKLHPKWIKGQITGPVSFCMSVTDENMNMILYDDVYREGVVEGLKMKALWQAKKLKEIYPKVILFLDEPYMASFGSSLISLSKDTALSMISGIVNALHQKGVVTGIHCCGNTDWSILFDSHTKIISLDAYEYGENFLIYAPYIKKFIDEGGSIAWGIVPTSNAVERETEDSLFSLLMKIWEKLETKGIPKNVLYRHSFITPSCGLGNVEEKIADKIISYTKILSKKLKREFNSSLKET